MYIAHIVLTALLAAYLTFSAVADFVRFHKVLEAMAKARVPEAWLPRLGAIKAGAVLGLGAGILVPAIGIAAAAGVIVFFIGAVITHIRARYYVFEAPLSFLVLAVTALALMLAAL